MATWKKLRDSTQQAETFTNTFETGLHDLYRTTQKYPGTAVTIIGNWNLHGQPIQPDLFATVNSALSCIPPDAAIFTETHRRILCNEPIDEPLPIKIGDLELFYSLVRSMRPYRGAHEEDKPLNQRFSESPFWLGLDEVRKEEFSYFNHDKVHAHLLFNRYPFAPYHFIFAPDIDLRHNQFLDPKEDAKIVEAMLCFVTEQGLGDGLWLCYNSNGAHASVNEVHAQGFFATAGMELPLERKLREQNYPAEVDGLMPGTRWLSDPKDVKGVLEFISEMNTRYAERETQKKPRIAYHLCMNSKGIACIPRINQGDKSYIAWLNASPFSSGYAFFEMMGRVLSPTRNVSVFDLDLVKRMQKGYQVLKVRDGPYKD